MSEMIVSCAGCGKRCRGASGSRKFKCAHCSNLLTFPDSVREASPGNVLCSFCWMSIPASDSLANCPACNQKVSAKVSGRCVVFAEASTSSQRMASIPASESKDRLNSIDSDARVAELQQQLEAAAKAKHELEAKVAELVRMLTQAQTDAAMHRMDTERAQRQVKDAQAEIAGLRQEMDHFRDSAVHALEPLAEDYNKLMKKLNGRVEDLEMDIRKVQEESMARMQELRHGAERLRETIDGVRREYSQRMAHILGTDAELTPIPTPISNPNLQAILGSPGSA
ncbi:MAG TPA: hypothetical protein VEJ63_18105 [Planctomycetota bacterium]|nr:hypothetical protein [Planctomycetota bacterium]